VKRFFEDVVIFLVLSPVILYQGWKRVRRLEA
jgi:hypothetical protein